jgi:flagellar protein FliL
MISVTEVTTDGEAGQAAEQERSPGRGKKILVLLVAFALVAGGAWFFLLRGGGHEEPKPGEMLALDSTQINLADGHYLKIGIALQLTETAHEVDGSKALDATIELFSGRDVAELAKTEARQTLKRKLTAELDERYHGDVMEVYFTEFVTQ